ncbi:hypothetical protein [Pseudomonas eucalypticola]|uniref:Uncharacterized protein n=1 Tax=Pseudomonas eucalypticola TaxID=2599595 RepID=A0A7D5H2V2_9PSED|nr:hypothetical protein [Pseudomonas eucalypticola]QKZ04142.1 hypothetical protein HWQ56_10245 [Pseudomonas eucalypticola]
MIGRNTAWRQGSLIKQGELGAVGIAGEGDTYAIVISHDCDIPHEKEEVVEVIVCRAVSPDKTMLGSRNPRKLHLKLEREGTEIFLELSFKSRVLVGKSDFSTKLSGPDHDFFLSEPEKRVLKQWLSARFGRPAYPNAFERHLQQKVGKKDTVERCIARFTEPVSEHVVAMFIGLDGDKNVELEDEPYCLSIFIVYSTEYDAVTARKECEALAETLRCFLVEQYGSPDVAEKICLENCAAIADNKITLADLMKVDQWRLEWLSLTDGDEDYVAIGHV